MTPERWQQVNDLFDSAVRLDPSRRAAFIEESCSDDESLQREVESLLRSDGRAWALIERTALEVAVPMLADDEPQLLPSQIIGRYEIVRLIGRGGMGEVYLARDEKLKRNVALKLLPEDSTRNKDRLRRFQQEAEAASALNHPNILTIHDLGEVNGQQFIATEFVDGETLRQRMERDRLELSDVLNVTAQVAGALATAHKAGIVHRDIKPENIMLRPDGYAKVLDFGLAKLTETNEPTASVQAADDVTSSSGVVMGTVRYMSPEQAMGLSVDARSDIFSLGVVLYEMLSGRAPFEGEVASDLIKSVINDVPRPLSELVSNIPVELAQIVSRALARNRAERYQTMTEFLADIEDLKRKLETEQTRDDIPEPNSGVRSIVNLIYRHRWKSIVIAMVLIAAAVGFAYRLTRIWPWRTPFKEVKVRQLVGTDKSRIAAVSPDGKYVAHSVIERSGESLMLSEIATNRNQVLVPTTRAQFSGVTFCRDGVSVYYVMRARSEPTEVLYRVSVSGGDSRKILERLSTPITFSPDGQRFGFVRALSKEEEGLFIANADGTEERMVAKRRDPSFFSAAGPSWSPDGKMISSAVLAELSNERTPRMHVVGISVEDGREEVLTKGSWSEILNVAWLSDSSGFVMAAAESGDNAQLWHVSYPSGNARRLSNDPTNYPSNYRSVSLTSDSKTMVALRFELRTNVWATPPGEPWQPSQITFGGSHRFQRLAWTPDGNIVFPSGSSGVREIWMMDGNGGSHRQLTADGRFNQLPAISPDGRYLVYVSGSTNQNIWRRPFDGSHAIQLTHGENDYGPYCSPDSRWVFYTSVVAGKHTIWKVSIDGGEPVQLTKEQATWPVVSPDGKRVAYWLRLAGKPPKIAIIPIAGGAPMTLIDPVKAPEAVLPMRWSSDGRALVYCVRRDDISNMWSQPVDGGAPRQLTDFKSEEIRGFDWSRDDRLLMSRGFTAREILLIEDVTR
jgi:serine/threonine protein kinase/Tol biopolymer transport system component